MAYYNDGKVFRNLPEQVEKNKDDIESIQTAQKTDESNINTNLNNINAHETRINALESLKMTQDGQNIKLTKSTGEIGNIAVGTVGGANLLGGNDVTFKTINGESITGDGNLSVDSGLSTLLWANLGIGRWANQSFYVASDNDIVNITDPFSPNYSDISRYLAKATAHNRQWGNEAIVNVTFAYDFSDVSITYMMWGSSFSEIELPSMAIKENSYAFACCSNLEKISVKSGCTVKFTQQLYMTFWNNPNLVEIGELDLNGANFQYTFNACPKLKILNCKHWSNSFDISGSTAFEQADLVNIISNLNTVSNGSVLTIGTTNLNKLTTDQIAAATGKGWTLA